MPPNNIKIVSSVPALVVDGHGVGSSEDGMSVGVQFIQVQKIDPTTQVNDVAVVASFRLSLDQAQNLINDVTKALADAETRKAPPKK